MTHERQVEFEQYLTKPTDYSAGFTASVARVGEEIATECRLTVRHVKDMNYSAGQALILTSTDTDDSAIRVYLSSKGPLFAIVTFEKHRDGWHESQQGSVANRTLSRSIGCVRKALLKKNLR